MLSQWLNRGIGNIVAPDENRPSQPPDPSSEYSFWKMVAPDPVYEAKLSGGGGKSAVPPPSAFRSSPYLVSAGSNKFQCYQCGAWNEISADGGLASEPTKDVVGMRTPARGTASNVDDSATKLMESMVLSAAKETAASMLSPSAVAESRNKVLRLCASSKPLNENLSLRLKKRLSKNPALLSARASKLGQLVPDSFTPLMAAAYVNHIVAAEVILKLRHLCPDGEDILHHRDLQGRTALHIAAEMGHMEMVTLLSQPPTPVNAEGSKQAPTPSQQVDLTGRTPFGRALVSPQPKAKKHQSQLEKALFSPGDVSVYGTPSATIQREGIHRELQLVYGHADMPGYRVAMEDALLCCSSWQQQDDSRVLALFAVCDGHGDQGNVSQYLVDNVTSVLKGRMELMHMQLSTEKQEYHQQQTQIWKETCLELDGMLRETNMVGGSTATFVLVGPKTVVVANVGDCRCILIQQPSTSITNSEAAPSDVKALEEATQELSLADDKAKEETKEAEQESTQEPKEPEKGSASEEEAKDATSTSTEKEAKDATSTSTEAISTTTTSSSWTALALSNDHKPNLEEESSRIVKAGMQVQEQILSDKTVIHKIIKSDCEQMAVSRSFGDFEYKSNKSLGPDEQAIVPIPDIQIHDRDESQDAYLVIACDGVWDVMTNQQVADFVQSQTSKIDAKTGVLAEIGDLLLAECLAKGSRDNMSVIIVALSKATEQITGITMMEGKTLQFSPTS